MCGRIRHRGPDEEGIFVTGRDSAQTGLGIRRLSIIDLSTGSQPIANEDGTIRVVCNGEIYNFRELRADLEKKGHVFRSNSDVEAIVHLYEERGDDCVAHLRGMFAFAVWDERRGRLLIARDRLGKKPLVYAHVAGTLVFASEIAALLEFPGVGREIDPDALDLYLTYQYVPAPLTAFASIRKLPPAHRMACERNGTIRIERYWDIDFRKKRSYNEKEWEERLIEALREATRIRMVSDVPLGAFLSGGIDSSAVVALMQRESTVPVKTFAIGFEEQDFSELRYAAIVAKHLGTDHHEFVVRSRAADVLPQLVSHYGEPFADSSALPSYYVARETRRHVTVALNGDGGDESFAGYLRYRAVRLSELAAPVARPLAMAADPLASLLARTAGGRVRSAALRMRRLFEALGEPLARRNVYWHTVFDNERKYKLFSDAMNDRFGSEDRYRFLEDLYLKAPANDPLDRMLYADIASYLPDCLLVKMDIASMANSLEARSPFLDHQLVELAASMPASLKLRGFTSKYILKKALKGMLPDEILDRGKKGFGIPVDAWFRGELKEMLLDTVLSKKALERGYFRPEAVRRLFDEHQSGRAEHGYRLWNLLMLELWHQRFIDRS